jgi:hypothetical protein
MNSALGIDTLGWEIFGSLFVLYWRDGCQTKAHDLHLLPELGQPHHIWLKVIFSLDCVQSATPHVCHLPYLPVFDFLNIWNPGTCEQGSGIGKAYSTSCLVLAISYA